MSTTHLPLSIFDWTQVITYLILFFSAVNCVFSVYVAVRPPVLAPAPTVTVTQTTPPPDRLDVDKRWMDELPGYQATLEALVARIDPPLRDERSHTRVAHISETAELCRLRLYLARAGGSEEEVAEAHQAIDALRAEVLDMLRTVAHAAIQHGPEA